MSLIHLCCGGLCHTLWTPQHESAHGRAGHHVKTAASPNRSLTRDLEFEGLLLAWALVETDCVSATRVCLWDPRIRVS